MKLVAITRILNEADIVEAFVRHTAAVADHHIFLDNGSNDATLDILARLCKEGYSLEIHNSAAITFAESTQNNLLFRLAAEVHGADWVLPLDTDEFIDARSGVDGFRATLSSANADSLKVRVREYVPTPGDDGSQVLITARIIHARAPADNMKVIARGRLLDSGVDLRPGGHTVWVGGSELPYFRLDEPVYAHYAIRSPWQWITKFVMGWSKVLAAGPTMTASGHSAHYREPFRLLMTDPAQIMRNPFFTEFRHNEPGLAYDPISYLGTSLRYTTAVDYKMRAVQALMTHLEKLSTQHGHLVEAADWSGSSR